MMVLLAGGLGGNLKVRTPPFTTVAKTEEKY
jgi:hypothetical protein